MIDIKEYNDSKFDEILEYCKLESKENHPASANMWQENWESRPETLPYILKYDDRFRKNGKFFLLFDNNKLIGCSGVYISDFCQYISIAGARTWVSKSYRNKKYVKDYFLPQQRNWAISNKCKIVALTFNDYNTSVIRLFTIGQKVGTRSDKHMFSKNFNILEYPVMIKNVPQWIIYENIEDYSFSWNTIRADLDYRQI